MNFQEFPCLNCLATGLFQVNEPALFFEKDLELYFP
jgi:hypothetical protein